MIINMRWKTNNRSWTKSSGYECHNKS